METHKSFNDRSATEDKHKSLNSGIKQEESIANDLKCSTVTQRRKTEQDIDAHKPARRRKTLASYEDLASSKTNGAASSLTPNRGSEQPIYFIKKNKESHEENGEEESVVKTEAGYLVDPLKLDQLISIHYYADYLRFSQPGVYFMDDEIRHKYDEYKAQFKKMQLEEFYNEQKESKWFIEKYSPKYIEKKNRKYTYQNQIESYRTFKKELDSGFYDDLLFEEVSYNKGPPEYKKLVDIGKNSIFIKCVPPTINKEELQKLFEKEEGYETIVLSDINPNKNFNRIGWVYFKEKTNLQSIVDKLNNFKVDNFTFYLSIHQTDLQYFQPKTVPETMCSRDRLKIDIKQMEKTIDVLQQKLRRFTDSEPVGGSIVDGTSLIHKRLDHLYAHRTSKHRELDELKKHCDFCLIYLRSVFSHCYYCSNEADTLFELDHRCIAPHYRKKDDPESPPNYSFLKLFDRRYDMKIKQLHEKGDEFFGGKRLEDEVDHKIMGYVEKLEVGKYRCKNCMKMFKGIEYITKHIGLKHPKLKEDIENEIKYFNNYAMDPNRVIMPLKHKLKLVVPDVESSSYLLYRNEYHNSSNNDNMSGSISKSIKKQKRAMQSYVDLDAPASKNINANNT